MSDRDHSRRNKPTTLGSPASSSPPSPWRSRGYLPHFDEPLLLQSLNFRLHDALPEPVVQRWKSELAWIENLPATDPREVELRRCIALHEDTGHGACCLRDERIASLVESTLLYFDSERYRLISWCVMPNHVHALLEIWEGWPLSSIAHSWKSYTARKANRILGRSGDFWFREYFDRYIRDERHFRNAVNYIEENPVKAGLARARHQWRWSSAWQLDQHRAAGGLPVRGE